MLGVATRAAQIGRPAANRSAGSAGVDHRGRGHDVAATRRGEVGACGSDPGEGEGGDAQTDPASQRRPPTLRLAVLPDAPAPGSLIDGFGERIDVLGEMTVGR